MKSRLYKKLHTNARIVMLLAGLPLKDSAFSTQPKTLLHAFYRLKKAWKHTYNKNYKKITLGIFV